MKTWQPAGFCSRNGVLKNLRRRLSAFAGNSYLRLRYWVTPLPFRAKFARTDIVLEAAGAGISQGISGTKRDGEVVATKPADYHHGHLARAQREHGLDFCGTCGGQIACEGSDCRQHGYDHREGNRISRSDAE